LVWKRATACAMRFYFFFLMICTLRASDFAWFTIFLSKLCKLAPALLCRFWKWQLWHHVTILIHLSISSTISSFQLVLVSWSIRPSLKDFYIVPY
jgi:hypothetical protein